MSRPMFPLVSFSGAELSTANDLLVRWNHKMGPVQRPMGGRGNGVAHVLHVAGEPVAVTVWSTLMASSLSSPLAHLTRNNTMELSRLCAATPHFNRVALRLFREAVWRPSGYKAVISYQDAALHRGEIYRCDGWRRAAFSHSGTDRRSGRPGRDKYIWVYPPEAAAPEETGVNAARITTESGRDGRCGRPASRR